MTLRGILTMTLCFIFSACASVPAEVNSEPAKDERVRELLTTGLSLVFDAYGPSSAEAASVPPKDECVILLHGLARTHRAMNTMKKALSRRGYQVINFGYSSTKKTVEDIAANELPQALRMCEKFSPEKIHFVTHSMGGIVLRQYLQTHKLPEGSRVVMLSPPNKGSELTDYLRGLSLYKWRNGPAGQQLGTGPHSLPNRLKPVDAEIGVITGNKSFNPCFQI